MADVAHDDGRYKDPNGEVALCSFCKFGCRQVVRNIAEDWRTDGKMEQFLCHSPAVMGMRAAQPRFVLDFVYECEGFMSSVVVHKPKTNEVTLPPQVEESIKEQMKQPQPPPPSEGPPPAEKKGKRKP